MIEGGDDLEEEEEPTWWNEIPVPEDDDEPSVEEMLAMPADVEEDPDSDPSVAIIDSGCTRHMTPDRHRIINYQSIRPKPIKAANKRTFSAIGVGDMHIIIPNESGSTKVKLQDVLYAPNMGHTLISIGQIKNADCEVSFKKGICTIRNLDNKVVG